MSQMFSPATAADLAARGIDCRAVVTDPVLHALSDLEIFQVALTEGRVLVTNNTFPRTKAYMSRIPTALADAATGREAARRGGVLWLKPPV